MWISAVSDQLKETAKESDIHQALLGSASAADVTKRFVQ
jgi:hypothetical protein